MILCCRKWVEFDFIEFCVYSTKFDAITLCITPSIFSVVYFLSLLDAVVTFLLGDPELTLQPFGHARLSLFFADTTSWMRNRTLHSATLSTCPSHLWPPPMSPDEPSMALKARTSAPILFQNLFGNSKMHFLYEYYQGKIFNKALIYLASQK